MALQINSSWSLNVHLQRLFLRGEKRPQCAEMTRGYLVRGYSTDVSYDCMRFVQLLGSACKQDYE